MNQMQINSRELSPLYLVFICLFVANFSFSQKKSYDYFPKQHIVKFNPASLDFGKISIGYENVMENNKSFAVQVGIPSGTGDFTRYLNRRFKNSDVEFSHAQLKSTSIRPSYRMYLSSKKRGPKGIYFEPSGKYQKFAIDGEGIFTASDGTDYNLQSKNKASMFGVGAQLGSQVIIADLVVVDFFFLGPELNVGTISTSLIDNGLIPEDQRQILQEDLERFLNRLPFTGDYRVINKSDEIIAQSDPGFIPGFRYGLQFGIAF